MAIVVVAVWPSPPPSPTPGGSHTVTTGNSVSTGGSQSLETDGLPIVAARPRATGRIRTSTGSRRRLRRRLVPLGEQRQFRSRSCSTAGSRDGADTDRHQDVRACCASGCWGATPLPLLVVDCLDPAGSTPSSRSAGGPFLSFDGTVDAPLERSAGRRSQLPEQPLLDGAPGSARPSTRGVWRLQVAVWLDSSAPDSTQNTTVELLDQLHRHAGWRRGTNARYDLSRLSCPESHAHREACRLTVRGGDTSQCAAGGDS